MSPNLQLLADFVTFTAEILKRKLHFLYSAISILNAITLIVITVVIMIFIMIIGMVIASFL